MINREREHGQVFNAQQWKSGHFISILHCETDPPWILGKSQSLCLSPFLYKMRLIIPWGVMQLNWLMAGKCFLRWKVLCELVLLFQKLPKPRVTGNPPLIRFIAWLQG